MSPESLDGELKFIELRDRAARVAPWVLSGDVASTFLFGFLVLGQWVTRLGFPEVLAWIALATMVTGSLFHTDHRLERYLQGRAFGRRLGALAIALGLAAILLALGVLVGMWLPDPFVVLFLGSLWGLYLLYRLRVDRNLYADLPTLPRWAGVARLAIVGGAAVSVLTTLWK